MAGTLTSYDLKAVGAFTPRAAARRADHDPYPTFTDTRAAYAAAQGAYPRSATLTSSTWATRVFGRVVDARMGHHRDG
ncbi:MULTISPECIES: hypothetical protein [Rhodococcus]|uniref:hypothetical protein n=1 Tax=Rhodococcus TaxID=1827 RepID=UPI00295421A5|nr:MULTISPECIES: hypothetical protein [Rhodococcus]MDV7246590.1 hypothetical protein [Rhodococcus oxybenzonivorans]MDV7337602.1 hypothetical protein [Rhodococcus oxybenzonivorans]MDV8031388.1 hypothetical protein [Rhodococcus sp. IEGM 27]